MESVSTSLRIRYLVLVLLLGGMAAGCVAPSKNVIDVRFAPAAEPENAEVKVSINEVVDRRSFSPVSEDRTVPQLVTEGLDDPAITARSVGLFWTAGGDAFWDLLLPEDRPVTSLVTETLENAFRDAGFTVVEPGANGAIPVTAEILRFWTWNTGSWTFQFHFATEIRIRGQVPPFETGETVNGNVMLRSAIGGSGKSYINTITKGLENFTENFNSRIR